MSPPKNLLPLQSQQLLKSSVGGFVGFPGRIQGMCGEGDVPEMEH